MSMTKQQRLRNVAEGFLGGLVAVGVRGSVQVGTPPMGGALLPGVAPLVARDAARLLSGSAAHGTLRDQHRQAVCVTAS